MSFICADSKKLYSTSTTLKRQDVEIIREWLKKQPHLPYVEDTQIILALHSTYYQVEAAKAVIDNYFTIKSLCPDIFVALPPDLIKSALSTVFVKVLPKRTPKGYAILMIRLSDFRPEKYNCNQFLSITIMVCLLYLHQVVLVKGAVAIFDARGFALGHLTRLNLNSIRHALNFVQEAAPVRIKEIHIINMFPLVDKLVALLKPFLKTELYNMLQFHSPNSDSLYESVPKECLPEEYGGQEPSCQTLTEETLMTLLDNYEFFEWHNGQTVDESKRLRKSISNGNFGVEGTFRKLELD